MSGSAEASLSGVHRLSTLGDTSLVRYPLLYDITNYIGDVLLLVNTQRIFMLPQAGSTLRIPLGPEARNMAAGT